MNVLGIMSGTSLDGLDMALCSFSVTGGSWQYRVLHCETIPYVTGWRKRLAGAKNLPGPDILMLDRDYGSFIADRVNELRKISGLDVHLIASHGHTVFHQPEAGFTFQAGNPQVIAIQTGIRTVGDFRQTDVLLGGQGAPLVPVGDELLFPEYDYCLNIGGFANISWAEGNTRLARDVCPANIILNQYAAELSLPFDFDGKAGRSGQVCRPLLDDLNNIGYYRQSGPGSLGREWLESEFMVSLAAFNLGLADSMRTLYEHIAMQVSARLKSHTRVLTTGGGAYNTFLIERISGLAKADIVIPEPELVEFKEAIVFALLGLLRLEGKTNCLASVTGAERDSSCGIVCEP